MKNLNSFILEEKSVNLIPKVKEYLDMLGEENLKTVIEKAISDSNEVIKTFKDENILEFINGHVIGRIIEKKLANRMKNINGFNYLQGRENRTDKDIICVKSPDKAKESSYYSLECKTSIGSGITGNKSYAKDAPSENSKDKNSFYILINNYKRVDEIETYNAYFGYIAQSDWEYSDKGNSSRIKIKKMIAEGKIKKII